MTILKFGPKRIIGLEHLERASSNQSRSETTTMARQIPEEFRRSSSFQDLTTMPGPCLIAILSGFFFLQKLDHCSNLYPNSLQTDIQPNVKFWKRPTLNTDSPELHPLCFWTGFFHLDSPSSEIPKVLRIQMFIWPAFSPRTPEAQSLRLSESRISSSICRVPVWLAIVCSSVEMKSLLEPVTVPRTNSASGTTLQKQQQRQRRFFSASSHHHRHLGKKNFVCWKTLPCELLPGKKSASFVDREFGLNSCWSDRGRYSCTCFLLTFGYSLKQHLHMSITVRTYDIFCLFLAFTAVLSQHGFYFNHFFLTKTWSQSSKRTHAATTSDQQTNHRPASTSDMFGSGSPNVELESNPRPGASHIGFCTSSYRVWLCMNSYVLCWGPDYKCRPPLRFYRNVLFLNLFIQCLESLSLCNT